MSAFQGRGKVKVALFSSGATFGARAFQDVGNASVFNFAFAEDKKELLDYQDPAGGTAASVTKISSASGNIDMRDFSAENFARVTWGNSAAVPATAIVGETGHVVKAGMFVPADHLINTSVAPVLKKGATVIAAGDYTVSPGGILFDATLSTAGVVDGDAFTIDYTPQAGANVEALINSAPVLSVFFEGVNLVTGKYAVCRIHKAKLGVATGVDLIGEDFGTLPISFTMEKDDTIVAAGKSKFFSLEQAS